jgi:hypothetical protein
MGTVGKSNWNWTVSEQRTVPFPRLETLATRFLTAASVLLFLFVALVVRSVTTRAGVILLAAGVGLTLCAFVLPRRMRPGVMLTVIVGVLLVWLANAALVVAATRVASRDLELRRSTASNLGYEFDSRSRRQVITDARRDGRKVVPTVDPQGLMVEDSSQRRFSVLHTSGRELLTLSGVANAPTLLCNEAGRNIEYMADEHGFRNDPGTWSQPADVLMVGDSFAHGVCVPDNETLPGLLRAQGFRVLSAAYSGNGPFLELATVREYARPVQPRIVVWVLYEGNDLDVNLPREALSPLLRRYLDDPRYSQELFTSQPNLDRTLSEYVEKELNAPTTEDRGHWDVSPKGLWDLSPLKELFRQFLDRPHADLGLLERILESAQTEAASWHGRLVLLYLPAEERWRGGTRQSNAAIRQWDGYHVGVQRIADRLQIPFIDALPPLDAGVGRDTTLFFPFKAHYTAAGYEVASRPLIEWLRIDQRSWSK